MQRSKNLDALALGAAVFIIAMANTGQQEAIPISFFMTSLGRAEQFGEGFES